MPTQGERQNFLWRPNDNSSTTLARYDQEAEHWYRAFKNAESKNRPVDYRGAFNAIGLIITFVVLVVGLAVMLIVKAIKWLNNNI
jgi:hypothetical protein